MSNATDTEKLDTCGCCEADLVDPSVENPPGQPALDYRIGTHSTFLRRMIARLPKQTLPDGENAGRRPLTDLTTRIGNDPAIALLEAWAVVGEVLTFYQERIANEGYLRTATERRSILELARAIGYELSPGVAAETYLAFSMDDAESSPDETTISAGTQVQSIPAEEGELRAIERAVGRRIDRRKIDSFELRLPHGEAPETVDNPARRVRRAQRGAQPDAPGRHRRRGADRAASASSNRSGSGRRRSSAAARA